MEEKENTFSGSTGNSDTDSPPAPLSLVAPPQVVVNMAVDTSLGVTTTATTTTTTTMNTAANTTPGSGELFGKKKRGRPRKYDADGNLRLSYTVPPPPGFALSPSSPHPSEYSSKRGRGRPPGSGNWQLLASLGEFEESTAGFVVIGSVVYTVWLLRKCRKIKRDLLKFCG
jgi:hypothetical protein